MPDEQRKRGACVVLDFLFGPVGFFANFFLDPAKLLFSLAFLVPLILLYLIRPKPQNVAVPSLMFVLRDMGKSNVHRFFRTIFKDILFLIQLLAILLLALSLAKPFLEVSQESLVQESVIVIDVSASAGAGDRFEEVMDLARGSIAGSNVIILAHINPRVLEVSGEERVSSGRAKDLIDDLKPTDLPGDLPTALDLAVDYAGPESKVTVISDFVLSSLEHPDLIDARMKVLRSKGALVETKAIGGEGKNIGIIDAKLNTNNATLDIKIQNFNDQPEEFGLEYNDNAFALPKNILEPKGNPGSLLSLSIPLGNGLSELTLTPKDDFMADNSYYVSIPDKEEISILVISNDQNVQQSRLVPALQAAGDQFTQVRISYGVPPKVPDLEHDMYVVKDVDGQFLLPGVIKDLRDEVERGKVLVVFSQPGLFATDFLNLLPVMPKQGAEQFGGRHEVLVNDTLSLVRGLSDIGQVSGDQLLRVGLEEGSAMFASVSTNDGQEPVIAAKRLGQGVIVYYGIRDRQQFDIDPQSYAILWGRIVDYSLVDPLDLNFQTGGVLGGTSRIKTPSGTRDPPVFAERAGFYTTSDRVLAANLYGLQASFGISDVTSARLESDINEHADVGAADDTVVSGETEEVKIPKDFSMHFILLGLAVLLFELLFIKFRGDL